MRKVMKYTVIDLLRSRWTYFYCGFFFILSGLLFLLSNDPSQVIITLMNVVLILVPLISTIFGVMYYYNSREFAELLLAQPIKRTDIFLGQYLGIACSLSFSIALGIGLPLLIFSSISDLSIGNYLMLIVTGIFLSLIFSAISFLTALLFENKLKGFGASIFIWLFFAIIYDALFLIALSFFSDYPLENFALFASIGNPIDLSRILIILKLDISALMGYTGALFSKLMGNFNGMLVAFSVLMAWIIIPLVGIVRVSLKKDF
ncbi:MAG: ABC transporter permease [Chitinophagales bacterium]|nr:ABC transporter permease [Chitinophagales bacterium]